MILCKVFLSNWCRFPAPDLVELQEDARRDSTTSRVDEAIGELGAVSKLSSSVKLIVSLANSSIVFFKEKLSSSGVVNVKVSLALLLTEDVVGVAELEDEHVGVNPGVSVQRSNAHTWINSNKRTILLPFWTLGRIWECLEEDEEADIPEGSKAGVVDGVEDCDESPGLGSSGQDCAIVRIVEEISEGFKSRSVPARRFDGYCSQQVFLLDLSSCVLFTHGVVCL